MFSIILSCVTEVRHFKVQGGSVIAAFVLAHNYVSEQFGNYVEYGISFASMTCNVCRRRRNFIRQWHSNTNSRCSLAQ